MTVKFLLDQPVIMVEVHSEEESRIPLQFPSYDWQREYRDCSPMGSWLYRENGQQLFLIGVP